ncbi:hypothetical protein [Streptomyces sp. SID11385]|uniref:hypothetical protein n=1 Tax=Streptomyces sp. SID11385 TaxID=2706031 RepID=UPI0013DCB9CD|nr:hypothetical protein [Streptomyces sp. SID11385]
MNERKRPAASANPSSDEDEEGAGLMARLRLTVGRGHVEELARLRHPVGAVEELIWNSLDGSDPPVISWGVARSGTAWGTAGFAAA